MSDAPDLHVSPARRSLRDSLSLVWLMPIGALAISLGIFWQSYNDQGPLIEIAFENASGVKANETVVKFRDVNVGIVEAVTFADKLAHVIAKVRLEKEVAPYVDGDAQFWVVRPEVTAQGVSGLDTVLSGSFIEGNWDNTADGLQTRFDGLPRAPIVRSGVQGTAITLRAPTIDGLGEGTPILYRGIEVGKVSNIRLADDGISVLADGFIRAPENRLLTTATRFWNTSGFTFSFGAQGAQLNVASLASLVAGGVAFDTLVSGGERVENGDRFQLFDGEDTARESLFTDGGEGVQLNLSVVFEGAVSGLTTGANVQFQGINVGRVSAITGLVNPDRFGDDAVRLLATLELSTNKLGLSSDATQESALQFMQEAVQRGYRAQLQSASLLTGGLKVAILIPDTIGPKLTAQIDADAEPYPMIPSIPSEISDFADTAEGVFNRINELPIEELLGSAINVMDSVNRLLNDESLTETPTEVLALLNDVRRFVGSDDLQSLPIQAADMIATLNGGANEFEAILQTVREEETVQALTDALNAASTASEAVIESVAEVPALITSVEQVAVSADALIQTANALPLDDLVARATALLDSIDALLNGPGVQQLPVQLGAAVQEAQGAIADLRASRLFDQSTETLAATENAIDSINTSLQPLLQSAEQTLALANASLEGVPTLIAQLESLSGGVDRLLTRAETLPLENLVAEANTVVANVNALLTDPTTAALPGQLGAAVEEAQGAIADLRTSGLLDQATSTLAGTETALNDVVASLQPVLDSAQQTLSGANSAIDGLPALIARIDGLTANADDLLVKANTLPLSELVAQASAVVVSANAILNDPGTKALPGQLGSAVEEAQGAIADVRSSGLIANAGTAIVTAEDSVRRITEALMPVLDSARAAADSLNTASADLPGLVNQAEAIAAQIEQLTRTASELPLDELARRASDLVRNANTLIASSDSQGVPAALNGALAQIEAVLLDMREGGLIDNANATLAAAESASREIARTSADLPALLTRMNRLLAEAESTISGYRAEGTLGSETKSALRDIRDAANSVSSLARAIERNPNSLLFGR